MFLFLILLSAAALALSQPLTFMEVPAETLTRRVDDAPIKNEDRGTRVEEMFREAGCTGDRLTRGRVNRKWPNVICTQRGRTEEIIVVGAHYDHALKGQGAVDNWSGSSLLASLYETLAGAERHYTYVFAGFAHEEKGLHGAHAFVKDLGAEGLLKVRAMINIDSIGMTSPKIWATRSDKRLLQMIARIGAAAKIPVSGANFDKLPVDSDARPFLNKSIPVLDVHSVTTETLPVLHSDKDTSSAIVMEHYLSTYRLLAFLLVYVDREFRP